MFKNKGVSGFVCSREEGLALTTFVSDGRWQIQPYCPGWLALTCSSVMLTLAQELVETMASLLHVLPLTRKHVAEDRQQRHGPRRWPVMAWHEAWGGTTWPADFSQGGQEKRRTNPMRKRKSLKPMYAYSRLVKPSVWLENLQ